MVRTGGFKFTDALIQNKGDYNVCVCAHSETVSFSLPVNKTRSADRPGLS